MFSSEGRKGGSYPQDLHHRFGARLAKSGPVPALVSHEGGGLGSRLFPARKNLAASELDLHLQGLLSDARGGGVLSALFLTLHLSGHGLVSAAPPLCGASPSTSTVFLGNCCPCIGRRGPPRGRCSMRCCCCTAATGGTCGRRRTCSCAWRATATRGGWWPRLDHRRNRVFPAVIPPTYFDVWCM